MGRFAPSPSGPLHAGSTIAALASYLDAKANQGFWYVRMEDLDPPRESKQAAKQILHALECLGLYWDGPVLYQSQRLSAYEAALNELINNQLIFPCHCTRADIRQHGGGYPGTCRDKKLADIDANSVYALRCRISPISISFNDQFQSQQIQHLETIGDFVVKRKDSLFAYQLAVVVDDDYQAITHVIRGIDLLDSSSRQIYLQQQLDFKTPHYGHIPIIVDDNGDKLSKQQFARPIDIKNPSQTLITALTHLQQSPEPELSECAPEEIIKWAIKHWQPSRLKGLKQLSYPQTST